MCDVLHVITGLGQGGAERALFNLLAGGLAEQQSHAVLSLRDEGYYGERLKALGVNVYSLGMQNSFPGVVSMLRLRSLVRDTQPEIVQGWMYHGNVAASYAAYGSKLVPRVLWNIRHSLYAISDEKLVTQWVIKFGRLCSSSADAVIYNSETSRQLHEAFGYHAEHSCVIPNGVDISQYAPDPVLRNSIRQTLGCGPRDFLIGHVARFHPMKDHVSFLRAAVQVAAVAPNVRFVLIGEGVESENDDFSGIVPEKLKSRFVWLGARSDVADLMKAMDAFCLSSWSESFPNVVVEAMASSLPCVVTDVGDVANVLGGFGSVVPPKDVSALKTALLETIEEPETTRKTRGQQARIRVQQKFDREAIVESYHELYESHINK